MSLCSQYRTEKKKKKKHFLGIESLWCADETLWAMETNVKERLPFCGCFQFFKSEIRENTVHVQSLCSIDREHLHYLFRVRVVLSGRWVRLWETAGFLDDILSLPEPSARLEQLSFLSSRMGRYICLRILSHCWHDAHCVCTCVCRCDDHFESYTFKVRTSVRRMRSIWSGAKREDGVLWFMVKCIDLWFSKEKGLRLGMRCGANLWGFIYCLINQAAACAFVAKCNISKYLNCLKCLW